MGGLLLAEFRKIGSTRLWWGLLIPVVLLSVLLNLFGGVFTLAVGAGPQDEERLPLLLASLAYALTLTATFSAVHGTVATAGEFRHRTITTTYLTAHGRGAVLVAKMISSAAVGAAYAVTASVFGVLAALVGQAGARLPEFGPVLAVVGIGIAVAALWSVVGAALGMVLANPVAVIVSLLLYMLLGELLISAVLTAADSDAVARISAFLPVNAGEVALYDLPARALLGPLDAPELVGTVAGVSGPAPWWGALLTLAGWAVATAALAWWAGDRRDVT